MDRPLCCFTSLGTPVSSSLNASIRVNVMGWRGTLRTIKAASKEAKRNAERRERALDDQRKRLAKAEQLEQAKELVEEQDAHLETLISLHKEVADPIDWSGISSAEAPARPELSVESESAARQKSEQYSPGFLAKLLKREAKQRRKLQTAIEEAKANDRAKFDKALSEWNATIEEFHEEQQLSERVLAGDADSWKEAISARDPFSSIGLLGSAASFSIQSKRIYAEVHVHGEKVVPRQIASLLKSGKATVKDMPAAKYYRLYQDYVCSAALRVCRELFALLPTNEVIITALDEVVSTQTGHLEKRPILAVRVPRRTLESLNLSAIDPSDAMKNFVHNMSFKASAGFAPVELIQIDDSSQSEQN